MQYSLAKQGSMKDMFLPESYNGLGYQNLIFMVFKLMRARDGWMRVNREEQYTESSKANKEPIHLVFIEEPEAHLHAQVQQVFIRKAYDVLRQHDDLKDKTQFTTQLIVSTHSPHIAHECEFAELRYFQRIQKAACPIPESRVISLATVFGEDALATPPQKKKTSKTGKKADQSAIPQTEEEIRRLATRRFVTRYLQTTHCDIFFADAVILVEGAGERILLPHFLKYFKGGELFRSYIAILEIGGSHAFRLRELIECLGLPTLIITDIDAAQKTPDASKPKACPVQRQQNQVTTNSTLKKWIPQLENIDKLLDLPVSKKIKIDVDKGYKIRVAYQKGIPFSSDRGTIMIYPRTFEDAFIFSNLECIQNTNIDSIQDDCSQLALVQKTLTENKNKDNLGACIFKMIDKNSFKKAEFALEMLFYCDPEQMVIPKYMEDGFSWLYEQLSSDNA